MIREVDEYPIWYTARVKSTTADIRMSFMRDGGREIMDGITHAITEAIEMLRVSRSECLLAGIVARMFDGRGEVSNCEDELDAFVNAAMALTRAWEKYDEGRK